MEDDSACPHPTPWFAVSESGALQKAPVLHRRDVLREYWSLQGVTHRKN